MEYNTLQHIAAHFSTLQHTATHCNTLQRTATHCNTEFKHTATKNATHRRAKGWGDTPPHPSSPFLIESNAQESATQCNTDCSALQHCRAREYNCACCVAFVDLIACTRDCNTLQHRLQTHCNTDATHYNTEGRENTPPRPLSSFLISSTLEETATHCNAECNKLQH